MSPLAARLTTVAVFGVGPRPFLASAITSASERYVPRLYKEEREMIKAPKRQRRENECK